MLKNVPQAGTKIRCVSDGGWYFLTKGKIYEVLPTYDTYDTYDSMFSITDDDGDVCWVDETCPEKFELVEGDCMNIKIGDWVTMEYWDEYFEVVDVKGALISLQEDDITEWYDTYGSKFTKKEDTMKTEVKATDAVADEFKAPLQDASSFKIGDVVWCVMFGKGEVTAKIESATRCTYPVEVTFDSGLECWFTIDGKYEELGDRTLFFSEPKIEASVTRPFVPTLVGKRVFVKEYGCYPILINITWEKEDTFGNSEHTCTKINCEVYEVSENLMKP